MRVAPNPNGGYSPSPNTPNPNTPNRGDIGGAPSSSTRFFPNNNNGGGGPHPSMRYPNGGLSTYGPYVYNRPMFGMGPGMYPPPALGCCY